MAAHLILSKEIAYRKLQRMAYEISERNINEEQIILAGIKENGSIIAKILISFLKDIFKGEILNIEISIDKKNPKNISLSEESNFHEKVIIVVDDVANSGKTLLYALKPILDFEPKKVLVAVLVDRKHKSFPITPDIVGHSIATTLQEHIEVVCEGKNITAVYLQ